MSYDLIFSLGKKVLAGEELTFDEAMSLTQIEEVDIPLLLAVANKVREQFTGKAVDTCKIVNARSGNCSEDCKFCAQSAHHEVKFEAYPLMKEEDIVAAAKEAEQEGCTVTYNEKCDWYYIRINFSDDTYMYHYTRIKFNETRQRKLK